MPASQARRLNEQKKTEHRKFSYISRNWRGRPLVSIEAIVNLIGATKTKKMLKIKTSVDINEYAKGIKFAGYRF